MLILGDPGAGKSDLVLRLLGRGFALVADDRVVVQHGWARAPEALAGLLEVRGLGVFRLGFVAEIRLALAVRLGTPERLPENLRLPDLDLPVVTLDGAAASAPDRVALALDCVLGRVGQVAGAFA